MTLRHDLGGVFLVSRDKVQEELKLTAEQKVKVDQHLRELLPVGDVELQRAQAIGGLQLRRGRLQVGTQKASMVPVTR